MARKDRKQLDERANKMDDAWKNEDTALVFKKRKYTDLTDVRTRIETRKQKIEDLDAEKTNESKLLDDDYLELSEILTDVHDGVAGHEDYGKDSTLYGGMGFVRTSERKSGLTRKKKDANGGS